MTLKEQPVTRFVYISTSSFRSPLKWKWFIGGQKVTELLI